MKNLYALVLIFFITLMTGCAPKTPGLLPTNEIWPYELYNRFNLRTVFSSYTNSLKYYCATYPKDFYRPDQLYMPDTDTIVIEDEHKILTFQFITYDQISLTDETKSGNYKAKHLYTIYYNEEFDDYRTDTFYIKKREECEEYIIPEDLNVSEEEIAKK